MGNCVICGSWSGYFPLCKEHNKEKEEGKIVKCEECKTWHYTNDSCKCTPKPVPVSIRDDFISTTTDFCIICESPSKGKPQCKNCYDLTRDFMDEIDKNSTMRELRNHYYNLLDVVNSMKDLETTQKYCNKLIAIALANNIYNDDSSLIDRAYENVATQIKNKKKLNINPEYKEERKENDEKKAKQHTAKDGHVLKSDPEVRIDDVLYNACILHCYEKLVDEIDEDNVYCDWFIPICNEKGIYIEYFGMTTEAYKKRRLEKEALYKKHNIPLIAIEKDDPKDPHSFESHLKREIRRLAKEEFGFMPEWIDPNVKNK